MEETAQVALPAPVAAPLNLERGNSLLRISVLYVLPPLLLLTFAPLLHWSVTREFVSSLTWENRPVEMLTFVLLLYAAYLSVVQLGRQKRSGMRRMFFLFFGVSMFVVAMEEIAWGQQFLHFETPQLLEEINRQGETTLHNIGPLQGKSEVFRILFGLAGIVGIFITLSGTRVGADIGVPIFLWVWFSVILGAGVIDLLNDYFSVPTGLNSEEWRWLSEVVELQIGIAAVLYVKSKVGVGWLRDLALTSARV